MQVGCITVGLRSQLYLHIYSSLSDPLCLPTQCHYRSYLPTHAISTDPYLPTHALSTDPRPYRPLSTDPYLPTPTYRPLPTDPYLPTPLQVVYRDGSLHANDDSTKTDNLRRASEGDVTSGLKVGACATPLYRLDTA